MPRPELQSKAGNYTKYWERYSFAVRLNLFADVPRSSITSCQEANERRPSALPVNDRACAGAANISVQKVPNRVASATDD